MDLPVNPPVRPMLAKSVKGVPAADSLPGGLLYEPKWDAVEAAVLCGGSGVHRSAVPGFTLRQFRD